MKAKLSRRDLFKLSGMTMGAAALGMYGPRNALAGTSPVGGGNANKNSYFQSFQPYFPGTEPLGTNEMRITFMGTSCIPRLSQAAVSVLVELGNGDHFMFDAGTGVTPKFFAMGHNMGMMDKIFLAHLHADHMGELPFIHGFGPYYGRSTPLYIWGPSRSNFVYKDPLKKTRGPFNDGTRDMVEALKAFTLWHVESQSFIPTSYSDYNPDQEWVPDGYRETQDIYEVVPTELDWTKTGFVDGSGKSVSGPGSGITAVDDNIAYNHNGVKITHFPAVHTRAGSMSYKLEWNGLSVLYSGDTLPSYYMVNQASGVDVLIHELVMPASAWNRKMGIPASQDGWAQEVQDSSHTPQKAFGYILSLLENAPQLAVGTHFQAEDDTIRSALHDIRLWYPDGDVVIASDFMVVNVSKRKVEVRRGVVSDYAWPQNTPAPYTQPTCPKYWTWVDPNDPSKGVTGDPTAQLDATEKAQVIPKKLYDAR